MSLLGVVAPDSSKDVTPRSLSSSAPTSAPPPPPPKNAARMLALALAESAQQVSIQSYSQSSEPPTPVSSLQPQEAFDFQDLSGLPLNPQFQTSSEEGAGRGSSPPPNFTPPTDTTASSYPSTSSPPIKQQQLELTSTITKPPDSAKCSTTPSGTQPETVSTPPGTPLYKCTPLSSSNSLVSPSRSPDRQQPVTGQVPVRTSLTSSTLASTPSGSCKESGVLPPQSVPEVSVISVSHEFWHLLIIQGHYTQLLCCSKHDPKLLIIHMKHNMSDTCDTVYLWVNDPDLMIRNDLCSFTKVIELSLPAFRVKKEPFPLALVMWSSTIISVCVFLHTV